MQAGELLDGRFLLVDRIGQGGMGVVFAADDLQTGDRVALKFVYGPEMVAQRFAREVAVLAAIKHSRIVRYVAHGHCRGGSYLAMEWLEGEDLAARLARGPLDLSDTLVVLREVSHALTALHERDVVHRDVKPSNIYLVDGNCHGVKLLDLGIVRIPSDRRLTATGAAIGTPAYMSPEQVRGETIDPRTDIYSVGCLFYECLTGAPPFHAAEPLAILARMLLESPPRLADADVHVSPAVEDLLACLLSKDRQARPANAEALLAALADLENGSSDHRLQPRSPVAVREQRVISLVLTHAKLGSSDTVLPEEFERLGAALREVALRHLGRLEPLGNGGFIAVFSGSVDLESQTLRAAAFALATRPRIGDDGIAIATGHAIIGPSLPYGPVIDRALALVKRRSPDIGLDENTARLLEGRFELSVDDSCQVLRGELTRALPRRTVLGRETRFVGRRRELAALSATFESCVEESLAAITLVVGDPGAGKSRLLREFMTTLRGCPEIAASYLGAADLLGGGAFGLISSALQRRAHECGEPLYDYVYNRLRVNQEDTDAARRAEFLTALVPGETARGTVVAKLRDDPVLLGDALADAWRALISAECERGAVVLILEDVHAGDASSIKLIDGTLRVLADLPVVIIASARPEVHERFPRLWHGRGMQELRLGDLSTRVAERLVRQVLGDDASESRVKTIVAQGGGNPLIIEELLRAANTESTFQSNLPDRVLALVQTRFDIASPGARRVMRAASVFGERFTAAGLQELLGPTPSIEAALRELVEREFLVPRILDTGDDYDFVHALIRDAAYASLADEDRVACHRIAGGWLAEGGTTDALKLAEHFEHGGEVKHAGRWYCVAAEEALEGNDLSGTIRLAKQALSRGTRESSRLLAKAHYWRGELAQAITAGLAAMAEAIPGSDPWYAALSLVIASNGQRGHNDRVKELLAEAIEQALEQALAPVSDALLVCIARGICQLTYLPAAELVAVHRQLDVLAASTTPGPLALGWIERVRAEAAPYRWLVPSKSLLRARDFFAEAGALRYVSLMEIQNALTCSFAGDVGPAIAQLERASRDAEALGIPLLVALAHLELAIALFFGERDAACLRRIQAVRDAVSTNPWLSLSLVLVEGIIAFDAGDYELAERRARFSLDAAIPSSLKVSACGLLARTHLRQGRTSEALVIAQEGLALTSTDLHDPLWELPSIAVIEACLALGDLAGARSVAVDAWTWISNVPFDDEQRLRYLRRRTTRELDTLILRTAPDIRGGGHKSNHI